MKSLCYGDLWFNREGLATRRTTMAIVGGGQHSNGLRWKLRIARARSATVICMFATTDIMLSGRSKGRPRWSTVWCLSRHFVPESGAHLQPRSELSISMRVVYGLGRVVLARPSPLCPPLVGPSAAFGIEGHTPDRVVDDAMNTILACTKRCWPPVNRTRSAGRGLPGYRVVGADDRRAATGKRA